MTDPTERRPSPTVDRGSDRSPGGVVLAAIVGAVGVAAGLIPGLFFVAWVLGAIAIVVGVPTLRGGRTAPGYAVARFAVFAGGLAVAVGVANLGIVLDWFSYFTTDGAMAAAS